MVNITTMSKKNYTVSTIYSARTRLALNLKRLRAERSWSQEQLAFEARLDRSFIAHVERGARNISLDNLEKLALAFGISMGKLLDEEDAAL